MKGMLTRLKRQGAAASLIAAILLGAPLVARAAPSAPAIAADAPLPPSTAAFSPAGFNLAGRVVSEQGAAIPGARVLIDAGKPRVGRGYT